MESISQISPVTIDNTSSTRLKSSVSAVIMRTMTATTSTGSTMYAARTSGGSLTATAPAAIWRRGAKNQLSMAHHRPTGAAAQLSGTAICFTQSNTTSTPMFNTTAAMTKGSSMKAIRM